MTASAFSTTKQIFGGDQMDLWNHLTSLIKEVRTDYEVYSRARRSTIQRYEEDYYKKHNIRVDMKAQMYMVDVSNQKKKESDKASDKANIAESIAYIHAQQLNSWNAEKRRIFEEDENYVKAYNMQFDKVVAKDPKKKKKMVKKDALKKEEEKEAVEKAKKKAKVSKNCMLVRSSSSSLSDFSHHI
jgi:hypothetical protein